MSLYSPDPSSDPSSDRRLVLKDTLLIGIMAVLAGCGLIYEYLLSSYAGRILGSVETAIFAMIGLMIVSMGLGAFAARAFRDPFGAFAWLESLIALVGVSCILLIGALVAFSELLPLVLARTLNLPPDMMPEGGVILILQKLARFTPYVFGFLIGFLIGMEIPLIARVRERVWGEHLEHNTGTIYGADYIGAGVGAAIWVLYMLTLPPERAAVMTAVVNLVAGLVFLFAFWSRIRHRNLILAAHGLLLALAAVTFQYGQDWSRQMSDLLYRDHVVFSHDTPYQHMTITERFVKGDPVYGFYLNGRLQFSSNDEHIYHGMLVYPPMMLARPAAKVLVIGGGDGLAVRDVLRFQPTQVTLIDLDGDVVRFFTDTGEAAAAYRSDLIALNQNAFSDDRVKVIVGDAFVEIDQLLAAHEHFDVVIVDLPDPSHPDLDRLYSDHFYNRLHLLLNSDGVMSVQSTSPYHAQLAFLTVGETLRHAGFMHVAQYRQNVPSFGEWGWSLASKQPMSPRQRLQSGPVAMPPHDWLTRALILAAFEFPAGFFDERVLPNRLGDQRVYQYHTEAWQRDLGIYQDQGRVN